MASGNHSYGTWIFPATTVMLSDCVTTKRVLDDLWNKFEAFCLESYWILNLLFILSGILQEIFFILISILQLRVISFLKYGKDLFWFKKMTWIVGFDLHRRMRNIFLRFESYLSQHKKVISLSGGSLVLEMFSTLKRLQLWQSVCWEILHLLKDVSHQSIFLYWHWQHVWSRETPSVFWHDSNIFLRNEWIKFVKPCVKSVQSPSCISQKISRFVHASKSGSWYPTKFHHLTIISVNFPNLAARSSSRNYRFNWAYKIFIVQDVSMSWMDIITKNQIDIWLKYAFLEVVS